MCVCLSCVDNGAADARGDGEKTERARGRREEKTGMRCNAPSFTALVVFFYYFPMIFKYAEYNKCVQTCKELKKK